MSWVRFGSPCSFVGMPWYRWCCDGVEHCPGSSVYVFESFDDTIECCGCSLYGDFSATTEAAMDEHLREHVAAGHHVPRILWDPEVIARAETFVDGMTDSERFAWAMWSMDVGRALMSARDQSLVSMFARSK